MLGGLSIAVPGELDGYGIAHQKFGKLPWHELFRPAIDFCLQGFAISRSLATTLKLERQAIIRNPMLRTLFVKNLTSMETYQEGDVIRHPILGKTLQIIANEGVDAFYNGSLSDKVVAEIREANGIINRDDLLAYSTSIRSSLNFKIDGDRTLITVPPPAAGSIVAFVLKAMQDFRLSEDELSLPYAVGVFHHRLVEAMKFAFSRKERLSDPDFLAKTKDCRDLVSELFLSYAVAKIDEDKTHPVHYYGLLPWSDEEIELEGGTSHLNVVTKDQIVSMTTSVSNGFGSKVMGYHTGIIYNNHMKEFWFDFKTCSTNLIFPLRRPISFMSPTIVVEPKGEGFIVIGGSGGAFIPSVIAQVIIKMIWFHKSMKESIDSRRFAHLLIPDTLLCERGYDPKLLNILKAKGHKIYCFDPYLGGVYTAVQAIRVQKHSSNPDEEIIEAYSDPRKGGGSAGY
ncbi:hypothetical protein GJ496_004555 [Pomphorhynchus laevis]|nr:hypothetical protein GJ496_004555 [Pomphorhynchus laevis]